MIKDLNEIGYINTGRFSEKEIDEILLISCKIANVPERIEYLSSKLLGIKYKRDTLIGGEDVPEVFVVNLEYIDCMTFVEYVESMRLSKCYREFLDNLKKVRYKDGIISYLNRNHFFTDWVENNSKNIKDVTGDIGIGCAVKVVKKINLKGDYKKYVPGIPVKERELSYIPSKNIDKKLIDKLSTGDYIGIFSEFEGLDVSHIGIFISKGGRYFLRHASSKKGYESVIDEDFLEYVRNKPGIIILRPI